MRISAVLATLALLALPLSAEVKVDYEVGVDFEKYRTYAWQPGTEAGQPQVQQAILRAVERELAKAGLRKVSEREADLYVVTHVSTEMDAAASGGYVYIQQFDVGVLTHGLVVETRGVLVVDLFDAQSERPVWRGVATEVMGLPSIDKLRRKVDKVTKKMFKSFPPS